MINRLYSWSIRTHLIILLLFLAVPSVCLIVYSGIAERHEAMASAKAECLKFVNEIAGLQQAMVVGAEQLATSLSALPQVQSGNIVASRVLFAEILKKNPQYTNIIVGDRSGFVWASGVPLAGKLYVGDRKHYRDALRTGMFSSGEYAVGRATGKSVMMFGYPVKNASNKVIAVIGITFDLAYAQQVFEKLSLPPGASFSLTDHQGIIITRNIRDPLSASLVGKHDARGELFSRVQTGPEEGTFEAMGNDGKFRLSAYKRIRLPHESKPYMYIRSSIPLAVATSRANAMMFRNLSVFVLLFFIGLFLAWFVGKRLIVRPAMLLKGAAGQLAAGADTVNMSSVVKGGELGEVARAFDDMAGALIREKTALRESERRWATTLSSIADAVIATDLKGRIAFMNVVAEEITGWTLQDASQKPVTEVFNVINEYTREAAENPVSRVLRKGQVVGLTNHTVLISRDGREIAIDDSAAPIRDTAGNVTGVVLAFHDITEKRKAEKALREIEEDFRSLFQGSQDAVFMAIPEGPLTGANPAASTMFGMTEEDFCTAGRAGIEDPDNPAPQWALEERARTGKVRYEAAHVRKDGSKFPTEVTSVILAGGARSIVFIRDITERKQAEKALREGEERFQALAETSPVALSVTSLAGKFLYVNAAYESLFGCTSNELITIPGTHVYWDINDRKDLLKALKETGCFRNIEMRLKGKNGEPFWALASASSIIFDGEQGVLSTITDITERKQAEEALRKVYDELEIRVQERTFQLQEAYETLRHETNERVQIEEQLRQSQKMEAIGTLAGGIAHDFNNILAAILGFTEMAVEDAADRPEVERSLQNVLKSAMRARELVKQILAFSRKTNYERSPLSLTPLIKETVQFLRASIPSTIEIKVDITTSWDRILAAPVEVQQIVMNLATNASLAMQEKGGTLNVSLTDIDFTPDSPVLEPDVMPGEYIQLSIKDTGVGMNPDVMKRVFEPFFTTREVGKGTGMGLAVVYGIVKDLLGTITVESAPGVGSTFRVFLPKVQAEALKEETQTAPISGGTERILFIDDEEMLVEWGRATLERLGYNVTAMMESREALNAFSSDPSRFDLVITDYTMPGFTGVQIAREFLKLRPDIPIILCTGHSETVSPEIAKEAGIREYLMKPVAKQELAEAVRRVLDKKQESQ